MKKENNVNFIFGLLDKKILVLGLLLEAILDFIYYVVPFAFTLFLTLPFTLKKAILVVSIFIISKTIRVIGNYTITKLIDNYLYKYENLEYEEYFKKLEKLPPSTLSKYQTGYLISVIEKVTSLVKILLQSEYLGMILAFGFFFYTAYTQSFSIFLIAILCSILCVLISIKILKKSNKIVEELYDEEYDYSSMYQDFISNIKTVKSLNHNEYFVQKIKEAGKNKKRKNKEYVSAYSYEELVRNTLIVIPFAIALIKAVMDLQNGIDTIGVITFYIALHVEMGFNFEELSRNLISWFELHAIKKKLNKIFESLDTRKVLVNFDTLRIQNVSIKYPETKFDITINNLEIKKLDKICITGKSGEGKTSILNLIAGNIDNYEGEVFIDTRTLKSTKIDMGMISQEVELFNMSIKENLCLGKSIKKEILIQYLKELKLNELLEFKEGLNTIVGEKGLKLSTGQKRRMNILRSYLMNKEVYILDEPTSNLDSETEDVVVKFILKYFKDKTLIIATHNPEIRKVCNKFYKVENHELQEEKRNG